MHLVTVFLDIIFAPFTLQWFSSFCISAGFKFALAPICVLNKLALFLKYKTDVWWGKQKLLNESFVGDFSTDFCFFFVKASSHLLIRASIVVLFFEDKNQRYWGLPISYLKYRNSIWNVDSYLVNYPIVEVIGIDMHYQSDPILVFCVIWSEEVRMETVIMVEDVTITGSKGKGFAASLSHCLTTYRSLFQKENSPELSLSYPVVHHKTSEGAHYHTEKTSDFE